MRINNQVKTVLLLGGLSALLVAVGWTIGPGATWLFLGLALALNLGAYFFSDRLVLRMHGATELAPQQAPALHGMLADLAQRARIPAPRLYWIDDDAPNAFATGRNPQTGVVAVTRGLVDLLDARELRGVLAHEVAHIAHRDVLLASVAAALGSAVTHLAQAASLHALFGGGANEDEDGEAGSGLFVALLAPVAATLVQLGISRSREFLADRAGAELTADPEALARALEKLAVEAAREPSEAEPATASLFIVSPLAGGALARLFSTHPPIEERCARLREMAREGRAARREAAAVTPELSRPGPRGAAASP